MISCWDKETAYKVRKEIDAITKRRDIDLTKKVTNCPKYLIKHVIGVRGSGLRRIERMIGGGCYIACSEGVFIVKGNTPKICLQGKIKIEQKIKELQSRIQNKPESKSESEPGLKNIFSLLEEDSDEEDDEQEETNEEEDNGLSMFNPAFDYTPIKKSHSVWNSGNLTISQILEDSASRSESFSDSPPPPPMKSKTKETKRNNNMTARNLNHEFNKKELMNDPFKLDEDFCWASDSE